MIRKQSFKLFLVLGVILFSLVFSGCSSLPKTNEYDENSYKKTGPSDIIGCELIFTTNDEFSDFVKEFNTKGKVFVSFDFDDILDIFSARYVSDSSYTFTTAIPRKENKYIPTDNEVHKYRIEYSFRVLNDPSNSDANGASFTVECAYIDTYEEIDQEVMEFVLQSNDEDIYKYNLVSKNQIIMEITITTSESTFVSNILTMLEENMIFLK